MYAINRKLTEMKNLEGNSQNRAAFIASPAGEKVFTFFRNTHSEFLYV